jgi:hypothetical protein
MSMVSGENAVDQAAKDAIIKDSTAEVHLNITMAAASKDLESEKAITGDIGAPDLSIKIDEKVAQNPLNTDVIIDRETGEVLFVGSAEQAKLWLEENAKESYEQVPLSFTCKDAESGEIIFSGPRAVIDEALETRPNDSAYALAVDDIHYEKYIVKASLKSGLADYVVDAPSGDPKQDDNVAAAADAFYESLPPSPDDFNEMGGSPPQDMVPPDYGSPPPDVETPAQRSAEAVANVEKASKQGVASTARKSEKKGSEGGDNKGNNGNDSQADASENKANSVSVRTKPGFFTEFLKNRHKSSQAKADATAKANFKDAVTGLNNNKLAIAALVTQLGDTKMTKALAHIDDLAIYKREDIRSGLADDPIHEEIKSQIEALVKKDHNLLSILEGRGSGAGASPQEVSSHIQSHLEEVSSLVDKASDYAKDPDFTSRLASLVQYAKDTVARIAHSMSTLFSQRN